MAGRGWYDDLAGGSPTTSTFAAPRPPDPPRLSNIATAGYSSDYFAGSTTPSFSTAPSSGRGWYDDVAGSTPSYSAASRYPSLADLTKANEPEGLSVWGQIKRSAAGVAPGLAGMIGQGLQTAYAVPRLAADVARGRLDEQIGVESGDSLWDTARKFGTEYAPLASTIGASAWATGERASALRRGDITPYLQASEESRIVDVLAEDVSNAAIFLQGAGRVLGRAPKTTMLPVAESRAAAAGFRGTGIVPKSVGALAEAELAPRALMPPSSVPRAFAPYLPSAELAEYVRPATGLARLTGSESIGRAGEFLSKAGRGFERAADPAGIFIEPLRAAGWVAERTPGLRRIRPSVVIPRFIEKAGAKGGPLARWTKAGREFAATHRQVQEEGIGTQRLVSESLRIAADYDLKPEQGRAVLDALSERMRPWVETLKRERIPEGTFNDLVERAYADVDDPTLRPSHEQVHALYQWQTGKLDEKTTAAMNAAARAVESVADVRTAAMEAEGLLPAEHTGTELLPSVIRREQRLLEGKRRPFIRALDREFPRMVHQQRVASAQAAVAAELPAPPQFKSGVEAGKDAARRTQHAAAIRELDKVAAEYARLVEGPPSAALERASANVDRLTRQAMELEERIARQARGVQAVTVLSRAGEMRPGEPRLPRPLPVRPEAVGVDLPSKAEVQRIVDEVRAEQGRDAWDAIEYKWGSTRPAYPEKFIPDPITGKPSKQHSDMWIILNEQVPAGVRARLNREGWLNARTGKGRQTLKVPQPDGTVKTIRLKGEQVEQRRLINMEEINDVSPDPRVRAMTPEEAMLAYIADVQAYWEASSPSSQAAMLEAANRTGRPPAEIDAILSGRKADVGELLTDQGTGQLDDLRTAYTGLPVEERAVFDQTMDAIADDPLLADDPTAAAATIEELLAETFPQLEITNRGGLLETFGNATAADIIAWMRTGDIAGTMRVAMAPRTGPQIRQLGRLAGEQAGMRSELRRVRSELGAAGQVQAAALRDTARAERRAVRSIDEAVAGEEALRQPAKDVPTPIPGADTMWRRATRKDEEGNVVREYPSRGERIIRASAVADDRARASRITVNRRQRAIDKANERIGDMPVELGRTVQERFVTDLNEPTMNGYRRTVAKAAPRLGGKITWRTGALGQKVPGLSGPLGRLARKYDVEGLLAQRFIDETKRRRKEAVEAGLPAPLGDLITPTEKGWMFDEAVRGRKIDQTDQTAIDDMIGADETLADIDAVRSDHQGSTRMNTPYRVRDVIDNSSWTTMPDDVRSTLRKQFDAYDTKRAKRLTSYFDRYAEAIPKRFRDSTQAARREIRALIDMAEEYHRRDPGSGDFLLEEAEDVMTTLQQLVDADVDPVHLTGGAAPDRPFRPGGVARYRKPRGVQQGTTGLGAQDLAGQARIEAQEAALLIHNRGVEEMFKRHAKRADQIPEVRALIDEHRDRTGRDYLPSGDLQRALRDAGYTPKDAYGNTIDNAGQLVLPTPLYRQLESWVHKLADTRGWRALAKANRGIKHTLLPFSTKWLTGNAFGNALQAAAYADLPTRRLVRRMWQVKNQAGGLRALWQKTGLPDWAPALLAEHGLHRGDMNRLYELTTPEARNRASKMFQKFLNGSYRFNEVVDNVTRSAVMLDQLKQGVPSDKAMQVSMKALGEFTRMTPMERMVLREIIPFYAWIRHQTIATMKLPIYHPVRTAWLAKVSALYREDDMTAEMLEFMGSKIPLGDRYLELGNLSPFATPRTIPIPGINPEAAGFAMSPAIRLPVGLATGVDIAKMDQFSRPHDTFRRGPFGQELATAPFPFTRPAEALHIIAGQLPYAKGLRDIIRGPEKLRYQTGQQITRGGRPIIDESNTVGSTILRDLRIPWTTSVDLDEMRRRLRENIERQRG